jgi:hypothetical protein
MDYMSWDMFEIILSLLGITFNACAYKYCVTVNITSYKIYTCVTTKSKHQQQITDKIIKMFYHPKISCYEEVFLILLINLYSIIV